ncbi:LLM class flavin-dependent oxidoreductase [Geodermatophilus sp. CPCC 206100]|uniref:LLM class flavin-dependent oxidoreductase n=1 Tax=Geodermatophilus sp. CPCC 206100 TaxID=3020054 RepID=UPI003B00CB7B
MNGTQRGPGGCEIWLHGFPVPRRTVGLAVQAEAWGFDGLLLADSENLVGDPYVELALAARETRRLRLGPAVTNPVTRHPVVTAAAVATLQVESGGRAVVVLGRGDSAVRQVGLRPATTAELEQGLVRLQAALRGEAVPAPGGGTARMAWIEPFSAGDVPVSVAATGPATITLAARRCGRVDLTVGADPRRVAWAVARARDAVRDTGGRLSLGAFVNVAVHPDVAVARQLVRGSAAIFVHFVAEGPHDVVPDDDRPVVARVRAAYDEAAHGLTSADHAALPDAFLDRFAVVGPPEHCVARLRELIDLGLDRIVVVPGSRDADPDVLATSNALFATEVLPRLRTRTRAGEEP